MAVILDYRARRVPPAFIGAPSGKLYLGRSGSGRSVLFDTTRSAACLVGKGCRTIETDADIGAIFIVLLLWSVSAECNRPRYFKVNDPRSFARIWNYRRPDTRGRLFACCLIRSAASQKPKSPLQCHVCNDHREDRRGFRHQVAERRRNPRT